MPLIIKLGYGVHGNESSAQNSSVLVAYYLIAGLGDELDELLDNTVILIDPCLNPDDFYLGKGSSYPDIHASIGILFEQAGVKGHLRETSSGIVSFPFAIRNQFTVSLSTLEAGLNMRIKLLQHQKDFYIDAIRDAEKDPVKAYVFEWDEYYTPAALYKLLEAGVQVRVATEEFIYDDGKFKKAFSRGTILIPAYKQELDRDSLYDLMKELVAERDITVYGLNTGHTVSGIDIGSGRFSVLKKPDVMMFVGSGISSGDAGEIWHLFDQSYLVWNIKDFYECCIFP